MGFFMLYTDALKMIIAIHFWIVLWLYQLFYFAQLGIVGEQERKLYLLEISFLNDPASFCTGLELMEHVCVKPCVLLFYIRTKSFFGRNTSA